MRFLSVALIILALINPKGKAYSQDSKPDSTTSKWKITGNTSLGFSQVALSNWSAGGDNSYSLNSLLNLNAERTGDKSVWQNSLNLGYGIQRLSGGETKKINDQIILNSQWGYRASGSWYYSSRMNLQTQFANGYDYSKTPKRFTSRFFSPAFMVVSLGMEYITNDKSFSLMISPISGKYTFVYDTTLSRLGAFGVSPGDKYKTEAGALLAAKYKKDNLIKNVNVETTLQLFSNYKDRPENLDINWQLNLFFKVNKYLATTLTTNLLYNDRVLNKIQFKEILSIGFAYSI